MADLNVRVIGDARSYERTLKKTEAETRVWARKIEGISSATGVGGGLFGLGRGGAALAGAGAAALALKTVIGAASDAQVILGQTSVAVKDAGLSWDTYSKQVDEAATRISKSSAFDDEAVLQSFQVFVRGQKDVQKSIELSALAADVARGRYTDLESATTLVNKAAMGQVGALRRAGIQIDANATATEALTALQAAYGGAAVKYANSAAGAQDNLRVSIENLEEQLGKGLLPAVTDVANAFTGFLEGLDAIGNWFDKHHLGFLNKGGKDIFGKSIADQMKEATAAGGAGVPGLAGPVQPAAAAAAGAAKVAASTKKAVASMKDAGKSATELAQQRNDWFDSMIDRRQFRLEGAPLQSQFQQLQQIQALIVNRINVTQDITRRLALEDQLISVQRQMQGVREQFAAEAVEHERKMADLAAQRKQAAADRFQNTLDWLDFAVEKADATKGIKDDIAAQKAIIAAIKQRIKVMGATLELQRALFRAQQALKGIRAPKATGGGGGGRTSSIWGTGSNPFAPGSRVAAPFSFGPGGSPSNPGGTAAGAAASQNALVRRGGGFVVVNQHFNAPTTDRHREARYALNATRAVFDG
jgi:hypothetical protein